MFLDIVSTSDPKNVPKTSDQSVVNSNANVETNNTKDDKYTLLEMSKELESRSTVFGPDSARAGEELKPNQPKDFSYPKRKFGKDERSFLPSWYKTWKWLHYNEVNDTVYCIYCLNAKRLHMLNDVKVEESFVIKGFCNWKNTRSNDKGFQHHESS